MISCSLDWYWFVFYCLLFISLSNICKAQQQLDNYKLEEIGKEASFLKDDKWTNADIVLINNRGELMGLVYKKPSTIPAAFEYGLKASDYHFEFTDGSRLVIPEYYAHVTTNRNASRIIFYEGINTDLMEGPPFVRIYDRSGKLMNKFWSGVEGDSYDDPRPIMKIGDDGTIAILGKKGVKEDGEWRILNPYMSLHDRDGQLLWAKGLDGIWANEIDISNDGAYVLVSVCHGKYTQKSPMLKLTRDYPEVLQLYNRAGDYIASYPIPQKIREIKIDSSQLRFFMPMERRHDKMSYNIQALSPSLFVSWNSHHLMILDAQKDTLMLKVKFDESIKANRDYPPFKLLDDEKTLLGLYNYGAKAKTEGVISIIDLERQIKGEASLSSFDLFYRRKFNAMTIDDNAVIYLELVNGERGKYLLKRK